MFEDLRTLLMRDWLEHDVLLEFKSIEAASSDASFRRYFRVLTPDASLIVMDAPPEKEKLDAFIKIAGLLRDAGIRAPEIYRQNLEDGFLLLEDFGGQSLLGYSGAPPTLALYQAALENILVLQTHKPFSNVGLPFYDEALLRRELDIFHTWFVGESLDLVMPRLLWEDVQQLLIGSALSQPSTFVHRDFHSRNLMVLADGQLGVLDFQDAVIGPVTYDLVSLLRDCYVAWPQQQVDVWLEAHRKRLLDAGMVDDDAQLFRQWFDLMGLQRHLKAIGIFTRLHLRDGKPGYLADIPRTFGYVTEVCRRYPQLAEFGGFLQAEVTPRLNKGVAA